MQAVAAEHELYRACEIIFGPELNITREFLEYLQRSGIKSAYRKRAMETHPDRVAQASPFIQQESIDLFRNVQQAYENLITFLDAKDNGYRLPQAARGHTHVRPQRPAPQRPKPRPQARPEQQQRPKAKARTNGPRQNNRNFTGTNFKARQRNDQSKKQHAGFFWDIDSLYEGPLPNRHLLLGHFLYYSGIINWRTIIQALIWQRTERPRLGELGQRFGMLQEEDILNILRNRPPLKPFGQSALEMGFLSEPQLKTLIFHQQRLQKKFGEFFLEKKILLPHELRALLAQYQEHNAQIIADGFRRTSSFGI